MAQGSIGQIKTVKKSEHWHRHGKHKPILGYLIAERRNKFFHPMTWFSNIKDAFASMRHN